MIKYIKKSELQNYLIKMCVNLGRRTFFDNISEDWMKVINKEVRSLKLRLSDEDTEITFCGFERDSDISRAYFYNLSIYVQKGDHIGKKSIYDAHYNFRYQFWERRLSWELNGYLIKFQSGLMSETEIYVDLDGNIESVDTK